MSHLSIRCSQKPHVQTKIMALCFIEPELLPIEVLHCDVLIFFYHFCSCDLDLDPMTFICKLDPYPQEIYRICENEHPTSSYWMRMRVFLYAWSLPVGQVTWHRWRSHHSILCSRKPHDTRKLRGSTFYRTGVILHCGPQGSGIFDLFAAVTLTLTRWPSYTNLIRIPWRYTECADMNFLR